MPDARVDSKEKQIDDITVVDMHFATSSDLSTKFDDTLSAPIKKGAPLEAPYQAQKKTIIFEFLAIQIMSALDQ